MTDAAWLLLAFVAVIGVGWIVARGDKSDEGDE
jgi:hypothetical protein